jgi:GDP-4-dehydro-6-deoxy-D-mannose reductase
MQMKSCFITGSNGFIGSRLAEFLLKKDLDVYGTIRNKNERIAYLSGKMTTFECDILDKQKLEGVLSEVKPDVVFHLAAQSKVVPSWQDPELTLKVNVLGTLHLLDAIKQHCPNSVVLVVEAAAIYGSSNDEVPINEDHKLAPSSPYAVSKIAQDYLAGLYWSAYGMKVVRIRPFNITGPGNIGDACGDFAKGIVEIETGKRESLKVGDLDFVRDITDVRDAVDAFWLLATQGESGAVYNLCSGKGYSVKDLLEKLRSLSSVKVAVVQDGAKKRVLRDNFQIGDNSKLQALGWQPSIPIDTTLLDMLGYWRTNMKDISTVFSLTE